MKRTKSSDAKANKKIKLDKSINQTIYIQNLNDKVNNDVLKRNLYLLCTMYGDIIDIVMKPKSKRMRGQAHIIFSNIHEASVAVEKLQDFMFFNKPIKASYSRKKSKVVRMACSSEAKLRENEVKMK